MNPLIAEYKTILTDLLARRASGPLSMEEEGRLAGEQVDIWDQLSETERAELEEWIEVQMARVRAQEKQNG